MPGWRTEKRPRLSRSETCQTEYKELSDFFHWPFRSFEWLPVSSFHNVLFRRFVLKWRSKWNHKTDKYYFKKWKFQSSHAFLSSEIYGNPILLSKLASTISFWFSNRHKIRFCFHSKQSCIIKTVLHSVKDHSLFAAHYGQVLRVSHGSKLWEMSVFLFHNSCSKRTSSFRYIYGLFLSQPTLLNADY